MGKFLETKYSNHQKRVIKKTGKSIQRCTDDEHKVKKLKRKRCDSRNHEPPTKKIKSNVESSDGTDGDNQTTSEFQDLEIELNKNDTSNRPYIKLKKPDEDLFSDDELKARYDQYTKFNFAYHIFDEIALEGLDGITIEAFWKRLNIALKIPTCLDYVEERIWSIICSNKYISFFELLEPRQDLVIFNRDAFLNKETNIFMEVYQTGHDNYKVDFQSKNTSTWGSCATVSTRIDISEQVRLMRLTEAYSKYKNKLVMVADIILRKNALFDELTDPNYEFTQTEYCILERIGRSREMGEITQGPAALGHFFNMDSKSIYHYCKRFKKENVVTKQFFCVRSTMDQSKIGRLLQLRRFYSMKKTKYMMLTESIVNYLKKCPGYKAPYNEVKSIFVGRINPKFFKNQDFLRYVNTNAFMPYKELYPDAPFKEYMTKSLSKERVIQMMELKDPFLNIIACWSDNTNQDSSDEEDENDDDPKICKTRIINMEFIREIYLAIHAKGTEGCNTQYINTLIDSDFHTVRTVLRKLTYRNYVSQKKCDLGRQKSTLYVATCFSGGPNYPVSEPEHKPQKSSSSAIERLKQKQKQRIDSLGKDRVYTRELFEADQQHNLLGLEKPSHLPITFEIPQIVCDYLISKLAQLTHNEKRVLAQIKGTFKPFELNLSLPRLEDDSLITLRQVSQTPEIEQFEVTNLNIDVNDLYSDKFKPDFLTKAFLLHCHLGLLTINRTDILELLDPSSKASSQAVKRHLAEGTSESQASTSTDSNAKKLDLPLYMGLNPKVILVEKDGNNGCVSELVMSTPPKAYVKGDITKYICPSDTSITERVMSRIKTVLDIVKTAEVFVEIHKLLKIIFNKEAAEGYDKRIDRKSLLRIMHRLVDEGYLKVYILTITGANTKKSQTYVCHPNADHTHEVIRTGIEQTKFTFFCGHTKDVKVSEPVTKRTKPAVKKTTSPFAEDDVIQSIQEINDLRAPKQLTLKAISSKKAGKLYGYRPKFARMSLLHEILYYLIYVMDKDAQPFPKQEIMDMFGKFNIKLTNEDYQKLPPIYCKEISWKMFIPPLPRHQGWGEGWALLCDVILRIPLTLMVRLYCINFLSTELQESLQHPIKRFYLIKHLPPKIQYIVMFKRKCIHDIHGGLVNLAYCGLLQFGPSRFKEKDQGFIYVNRNASLLETLSSEKGYHKVTAKQYPKVSFYFDSLDAIKKYWVTMHNICMNTPLNVRHVIEGKTITLIDVSAKPSLKKSLAVKNEAEVQEYDTGEIPGDRRGAAGLDSALWSHIQKNWFYFALKSSQKFHDEFASLKLDETLCDQVPFDQLKLPAMPDKFYISKQPLKQGPIRSIKAKRTSKKVPMIRKVVPFKRKLIKRMERDYYDAVDRLILKRFSCVRFRPAWSEEEDKLLILLKFASTFLTPGSNKQMVNYTVIRDVMHCALPESRNKTSRAVPRRWKILSRDLPFLANMNRLVLNLYKLPAIARYFVPLRNYIIKERDGAGKRFKLSDSQMNNAFLYLAYYVVKHQKEVETALHGNFTTMDYLDKTNLDYTVSKLETMEIDNRTYTDPTNEDDIRMNVLKNIFHSALGHKSEHPAWSYQMYKIYQKFSQDVLKGTLDKLREVHMIQYKKEALRKFFTPYKLSFSYIVSQTTTFTYQTMENAFRVFSDLKSDPKKIEFTTKEAGHKKYGQLFGLNEVITFMFEQVDLKLWFPDHHFALNPAMEDHSQVIGELARRYQAKLKIDQKVVEMQDSVMTETTAPHQSEPEPGSSTNIQEDIEALQFDEENPLDLTITSSDSTTISNLKHWISDCIDAERVRSPSPELLNLDISQENHEKMKAEPNLDQTDAPKEKEDRVLTLEEIKREMLEITPSSEKRQVPYITDLAKLLSENFDELETDDQKIEEMKSHFVKQYPKLEDISINGFKDHFLVDYLENRPTYKDIWRKVERGAYIDNPSTNSEAFDAILTEGGTVKDVDLMSEIIDHVYEKKTFGATGPELKERFSGYESDCSLEFILKILMDHSILLRTGVCTITFVHHEFQNPWLTDTFVLTDEHVNLFGKKTEDKLPDLEKDIDKSIQNAQWLKIKSVPWINVDGILDKELFKLWLTSVFSYCVENPKCLFSAICDKFCYLKPVDLFYLAEILDNLGCLEIRRFQSQAIDLSSEYEWVQDRKASFLDKLEEIYVEPNQVSFIVYGSFVHSG